MPTPARLNAFIAMVEAGDFVRAIEDFYVPHATAQENLGRTTVGRAALVAKEEAALARGPITTVKGSIATSGGDYVAIRWVFDIGGGRMLDEIAWQRWEGEHIVEERFYYDPAQMAG